ncbi:MAG TPA: O-antigen ligase family protein [Myxococcales bacterium]
MDRRRIAALLVTVGLVGHGFFVPISIAGMQIALAVAALGLFLDPPRPLRTPLDLPAAAFVLVCILSDLVSPFGAPPLAFATLWRALFGYFVVAHGLRKQPRTPLFAAAAIGLSIAAVVGLVQYRTGVDLVHLAGLRSQAALVQAPGVPGRYGAMGFFISRLTFGHIATILTALLAGSLASGVIEKRRSLFAIAVALSLSAVAVTFDRAAWLGLAVAALAILFMTRNRLVFGAILAGVLLVAALQPGVRQRFRSSFSAQANGDRVFIWARAQEIIRDHPLRGIGFGNYPRVCGAYYDRVDKTFPMRTWAHNLELSTLAETGPLGLLCLFWLLGAAAVMLVRKRSAGGLAALLAFVAVAQAHDLLYDNKVMYALWLAVALAASTGSQKAKAA